MKIVLKLQFLTCNKYSEHRSTVKNCNFSKLQFFKCTFTVIPLHIFAVSLKYLTFKCKNKDISTIWRPPGIPGVSKDAPLSTELGFGDFVL